jgi:hypothetical protein
MISDNFNGNVKHLYFMETNKNIFIININIITLLIRTIL